MARWAWPTVALAACLPLTGLAQSPPVAMTQTGVAEEGGLRIAWTYTGNENESAAGLGTLDVHVSEAATGAPGRYPRGRLAAWLQRRRASLSEAEVSCPDKVRMLATQGVGRRAEIDLNAYRLVTLNTDGTLAVINPFVAINNAKLESIVELGGIPVTWLVIPERMEAWVVLAEPARLVAVDLHARRLTRAIDVPTGSGTPTLAWDTAERQLWLGYSELAGLGRLDPERPDDELRIVPAELVSGLFADPELKLTGLVSLHAGGSVALRAGDQVKHWTVPGHPRIARYSALARRLIVATAEGGISWIDPEAPDRATVARHLALSHPVVALELFDEGRRALALGGGRATVIDLATGRSEATLETAPGASEIRLTDRFAYALSAADGRATLWSLANLRAGQVQPVNVAVGRASPGAAMQPGQPARATATPSGTGLLTASPVDGMIYQYAEGMMAPIGSYSNYRRAALGLHLLDLSLREVAPGHYRSPVRHANGGPYELVLSGAGPRFAVCAPLQLAAPPAVAGTDAPSARLRAELVSLSKDSSGSDDEPWSRTVRLRLREEGSHGLVPGVHDLTLLVFDRRSGWQTRTRLQEAEPSGEYLARVSLPGAAQYEAMISSASRNLSFVEGRVGALILDETP